MDVMVVNFQVVLGNPKVFSIEFAPDGLGSKDIILHHVIDEFALIDNDCIKSLVVQECHVQSLWLIHFDCGNYFMSSDQIDLSQCEVA